MRRPKSKIAALVVVAAAALLAPSPALASKGQWSIFEDHTALVQSGVKKRIDTLNRIEDLGADTLRIEFHWNEIAHDPKSKSKPNFDAANPAAYQGAPNGYPGFGQYDDLVVRAPRWASG